MPELPEVETIKRELNKKLKGKIISGLEILWAKTVAPTHPNDFIKIISGRKILDVKRRAKMILLNLDKNISLAIHLKMTGQLIYVPVKGRLVSGGHLPAQAGPTDDVQTPGKHTRLIINFNDGSNLYFNDLRKFGWVRILDKKIKEYLNNEVGPEPLSKSFTFSIFKKIIDQHPNRTVKQVLLDQSLIAGIGNIYADESSFLSHLLPTRKIGSLTEKEKTALYKNIIYVLKLSIKKKGTSSKNYRRSNGEPGGFVPHLMVYGRNNETCKNCAGVIKKIKHAGRGTHYCPICQK